LLCYTCMLYLSLFLCVHPWVFCVFFVLCVVFLCSFLQYFDTVGWVFWPVKTVSHITYTVLEGTLNTAQSNPSFSYQPFLSFCGCCCWPASRWPSFSISLQNKWTPLFAMLMYLAKPLPTELHITFVRFSQRSLAAWFVFARIRCIIADECILFISLCWRCSAWHFFSLLCVAFHVFLIRCWFYTWSQW